MRIPALTAVIIATLATTGMGAAKPKKPRLDLRAAPRMAFSPVNVLLTAELNGGEDVEQFYCPALEWDWDDGSKSVQESDCPPLAPGVDYERRYTATHAFRQAGNYNVKVTLRKANRTIAVGTASVSVRAGAGDFASLPD
jgi:PKD repeat protein